LGKIQKIGTSRPLIGQETWGPGPPAHPAGGRFPEGLFANKKVILFAKRSLRGYPAHPKGGRWCRGASRPLVGQEVPPGYISPQLPLNFHFIQQKSEKKKKGRRGREKRKRRNTVHTSIWRYILILPV
jgi:hypothetical protein